MIFHRVQFPIEIDSNMTEKLAASLDGLLQACFTKGDVWNVAKHFLILNKDELKYQDVRREVEHRIEETFEIEHRYMNDAGTIIDIETLWLAHAYLIVGDIEGFNSLLESKI